MSPTKKNNPLPEARVAIAVPLGTPWIYWRTMAAILEMEKPDESDLMVFQGALVDRARNILIEQMLHHPMEPTHLLFLDADIVPPAETLVQLLKHQVPIVSGLYRKRLPPHEPMAFVKRKKSGSIVFEPISLKGPKLKKVDVVGAGCLLIQRDVFENISEPWFTSEWTNQGHLSEDFSFCEKAKQAGYEIYVDMSARLLHLEPMGVGTDSQGKVTFVALD